MIQLFTSRAAILFRPPSFIILFVLLTVFNALLALITSGQKNLATVWLISVFVHAVLGWFTFKRSRLCTWVLSGLMLFSGLSTIILIFPPFLAHNGDIGMQIADLVIGAYFVLGGIVLFLQRPRGLPPGPEDQE